MLEAVHIDGPDGFIHCDPTHWPIAIATWVGPADEAGVRRFFAWNERVVERARGTGGYVLITDADRAQRPAPSVRRLVAELTDAMPEDATALSVGNYVVVSSRLIRGAMTAMQWLSNEPWTSVLVGTMHEALVAALDDLDHAGLPRPTGLDPTCYARPA